MVAQVLQVSHVLPKKMSQSMVNQRINEIRHHRWTASSMAEPIHDC